MDQKTYLKQFSGAVRWRLPKSEADEVIEDYQELLSQRCGEQKEVPIQELGEPIQAARLLSEPKPYRRWLAVFAVMSACLLLPEVLLLQAKFSQYPSGLIGTLFMLGLTVSLIWFRPRRREKQISPIPKRIYAMLLVLLLVGVAVAVVMAGLSIQVWKWIPPAWYGRIAFGILLFAGTVGTVFGFLGLVKARLSDYRWRSLYVMGLTVLAECVLVLALLVSTAVDASSPSVWFVPYVYHLGIIGVAGFVGTGVSLC